MGLVYDLFAYAFTAVLLSFVVSKLISLVVSSGEVGGGKESCAGGGVGEGNLQKKLKVEVLKSLKKRRKKISCETVLVSEFKGETEPDVADESLAGLVNADDDRKELAFSEKKHEFVETDVSEACSAADQMLSAGEVGGVESSVIRGEDGCFGVNAQAENKGMISSSEITLDEKFKEVGCPVEGLEQEISSGNDLEKLVVSDQRTDCEEDDMAGEELGRCDFYPKEEEAGSVGHADQELMNVVIPSERREASKEVFEQDEGRERSEPQIDDHVDVGLLGGENIVDDHHEHQEILESLETESKVCTQDGYADQVDDQKEELMSSVSKEDVVNRDEERSIGENAADDQHKHQRTLDSLEIALKDGTQDGYVNQVDDRNEEIRDEEGRTAGDEGKGEMEISDGEEWEGIERNELERDFVNAMNFVECGNKDGQLGTLGSDVIMQFYGLQKVSMEGPCHEPPPMALKLSARAKWNAWQKLGSMIPEEAMEKYINLLSEKVPGWMGEHPFVEEGELSSEEDGACSSSDANISTTLTMPLTCIDESKREEDLVMRIGNVTGNSSSVSKDEE